MQRSRLRALIVAAVLAALAGVARGSQCNTKVVGLACVECSVNASSCSLCRATFRKRLGLCQPCTANCLLCTKNAAVCERCAPGFYITATGRCARCQVGCAGACAKNGTCPGPCLAGYGKVGGNCVKCTQPRCNSCDGNATACTACQPFGYALVGGACQGCSVANCNVCRDGNTTACKTCFFGYYRTASNKCSKCQTGCVEGQCRQDGTCKQCKPTYGLVNGYCKQCMDGCLRCDRNQFACTKCERNRGLIGTDSCNKCDPNIRDFDTCEWCDGDIEKCSSCGPLEFMQPEQLCQICNRVIANCATCSNSTATLTCSTCFDGFRLNGNACQPCPRGCLRCTSATTCTRCDSFYVRDAFGRCIPL